MVWPTAHKGSSTKGRCPANAREHTTTDDYTATGLAEGFIEADDEQQIIDAWQHLHDTGLAYRLQGWFGRTAQDLIAQGVISE